MYASNILLIRIRHRVWEQKQRRGQTYPPRSVLLSADAGSDGDAFLTQSNASAHKHKRGQWGGRPAWFPHPHFSFISDSEMDPSIRAARSLIGPSASLYYANIVRLQATPVSPHSSEGKFIPTLLARPPWNYWSNKLAATAIAACGGAHVHVFRCTSMRASFYLWPSSSLLLHLSSYCSKASFRQPPSWRSRAGSFCARSFVKHSSSLSCSAD